MALLQLFKAEIDINLIYFFNWSIISNHPTHQVILDTINLQLLFINYLKHFNQ